MAACKNPEDPRFSEYVRGHFGDAVQRHDVPAVQAAIAHPTRPIDVNVRLPSATHSRETALFRVIGHTDTVVLDLLLDAGADVHHRSASGHTPLTAMALAGNRMIAQRLVMAGAQVHDERLDRQALHHAARNGRGDMVRWLVEQGAQVNHLSGMGRSALHDALDYPDVVQLLLDMGADASVRDAHGRTPREAGQEMIGQNVRKGFTIDILGATVALLERHEIHTCLTGQPKTVDPDPAAPFSSATRSRNRL